MFVTEANYLLDANSVLVELIVSVFKVEEIAIQAVASCTLACCLLRAVFKNIIL
jgi:hypothetical protein